jgi:hypothetical protein
MMKRRSAILMLAFFPAVVWGQQPKPVPAPPAASDVDTRVSQIQAARANGIANLREQVLRTKLGRNSTVGEFLDRAQATDGLNEILDSAQPVGGPRWVDDHVCQVRLELAGPKVSAFLMSVARDESRHSGIKSDALKAKLDEWTDLKFTGVGCSAEGEAAELAKPHASAGKWSEVGDTARRKAIAEARADAVREAIKSIGAVKLDEKLSLSEALSHASISQKVSAWISQQPVTRIEFLDDLKLSVTISVTSKSLEAQLKSAVGADGSFSRGLSVDWSKVSAQLQLLPGSFSGSAAVSFEGTATTLPVLVLPLVPPDWVDQELEAEGVASAGGLKLKVGVAAQANAVEKIRQQFVLLHVDANTTLGEAADQDPALKQAIDRAMKHVHTSRVDYFGDGSVRVKITLNLRDAWDELRAGN